MISAISIEIAAKPGLVFELARHVERWEVLLPHYVESRAVGGRGDGAVDVRFVARRELVPFLGLGLPVAWRARTWNEPDALRLRFVHTGGATMGMDVTWRIEPAGGGCGVTIEHDFRPRLRAWATLVDRLFVRPIASETLRTFRAIAEAAEVVEAAR